MIEAMGNMQTSIGTHTSMMVDKTNLIYKMTIDKQNLEIKILKKRIEKLVNHLKNSKPLNKHEINLRKSI